MVDKLEFYVSKGFSWKLPCIFVFKTDSQYMYLRKRTVIIALKLVPVMNYPGKHEKSHL